MKLFLSGGGGAKDSFELDKMFVSTLDLSKPILYIPIAINTAKHPYLSCVAWLKSILSPFGVSSIIMWTENDLKDKTKEDFEQFCGIYIGGGNTYKLLKEIKEFGLFDIISNLAKEGVPIYGGSAGAIILSRTIIPAGFLDENKVRITDFSALNLLNEFDLWCHYSDDEDDYIDDYMKRFNLKKMIALPENGGLFVNDNMIEIVGTGEVCVFEDGKKTYFSGQIIV